MSAEVMLEELRARGIELFSDGNRLKYRCPSGAMTDNLRQAIREHKAKLITLLTERRTPSPEPEPPLGKVGRHGKPCPVCSDTWQWPTTTGAWICAWCFAGGIVTAGVGR
jgi:hypothetical protein